MRQGNRGIDAREATRGNTSGDAMRVLTEGRREAFRDRQAGRQTNIT